MKKLFLFVFIFLDLCVMAGAALVLYMHFSHRSLSELGLRAPAALAGALPANTSTPIAPPVRAATNSLITPAVQVSSGTTLAAIPSTGAPADSGSRNIKFAYRNPKARQVSIRADFTGWKAVPMVRDPAGIWGYQAALAPGEYAYCFTVDDKTFKDPANKRTKQIGRTFVSSILVKPNTAAPH